MRARVFLLISLGLNVALAVLLFYALSAPTDSPRQASTNTLQAAAATNKAKPRVVVRRQFFSWNEIESNDYPTYIANLRSISCPEATIRDIIVADVNQLYAQKRAAVLAQYAGQDSGSEAQRSDGEKLRLLDEERRALLTRLLGPSWEGTTTFTTTAIAQSPQSTAVNDPVLGQISAEVRQALQEVNERAQQRLQAYLEAQRLAGRSVDQAHLARLRQQVRDDLARVLTPLQLEEYLLHYSASAQKLRSELEGLRLSTDGFRQLFRICDPIDQQIELYYSGNDPVSVKKRQELQKQREAAMKLALSPDRFQRYQLLQDPVYRQTQAIVEQLGAPPDTLMPLYQVNQIALAEQQRIKNDLSLTAEEREKALQHVLQEQQKSMRQILGDKPVSSLPPRSTDEDIGPPLPEELPRP
jgi:hypothetical protein